MPSAEQTQISAFVSKSTREKLERYARAHGVKKAFLIESALLHHLEAIDELPAEAIIPPRIVVSRASGARILERLQNPGKPTKAMRALFRGDRDGDAP